MKTLNKKIFYSVIGISLIVAIVATWFLCRIAISWGCALPEAWQSGAWPLCMSCLFFVYAYVVDRYWADWKRRLLWIALYVGIAYGGMALTAMITLSQTWDKTVPLGWGFSQIFAALFGFFLVVGAMYTPKKRRFLPTKKNVRMLTVFAILSAGTFIGLPFLCYALGTSFCISIIGPVAVQLIFNLLIVCVTVQCKRSLYRPWIGYTVIIGSLFAYLTFTYVTAALLENGTLSTMPLAYLRGTYITANACLAVPTVLATVLFVENRYDVRVSAESEKETAPSA